MNKKAYVICDGYDDPEALIDLENSLSIFEIKLVKVTNDFYINTEKYLTNDEPVLFYRNPYIRYSNVNNILNFHYSINFKCITAFKEVISIRRNFFGDNRNIFNITNVLVSHYKPKVDYSPIIIFGHNRLDYLKLSLNSILFSLLPDDETPILIGMSNPNEEYRNFCIDFSKKNKNVFVYETKINSYLAIVNLIVKKYNPKSFIVMEEDYILPHMTKFLFPYWTRQYTQRLNNFDLIFQITDMYNLPYDFFNFQKKISEEHNFIHQTNWFINKNIDCIGSGLGIKTKDFFRLLKDHNQKVLIDGFLKLNSKNIMQMGIVGYHIGWNQEIDGYKKLGDFTRFPEYLESYELIDHSNQSTSIISINPE